MRTRNIGRSGVAVGEVGLGTWGLSGEGYGPVDDATVTATLDAAADAGVTFFETADSYAEGKTLEALGALKRRRPNDNLVVSVRVGLDRSGTVPQKNFTPKFLRASCEATLKRLGVDCVDALVLHNPMAVTLTQGDAWRAMRDLQAEGKARLLGVGLSSEPQGLAAVHLRPDLVVLPYNLLFPQVLHALAGELSVSGVGVVARSPLAYGVLADTWGATRRFTDDDHRTYRWVSGDLNVRMKQREALRTLVHDEVRSMREAAIRYVLANGLVSVVVPGARTPQQARENASAADTLPYLPPKDLAGVGPLLVDIGVL